MRKGITVAGNMIIDILYPINGLPAPGELTTILDGISRATGGALCNVVIDLARLDNNIPLYAIGRVGTDQEGDNILNELKKYRNIDISEVKREGISSFTSVMADIVTKQRTFFHYRGANAKLDISDIDFSKMNSRIFHIGYILLLDALDMQDETYGTKMARLLHDAKKSGIMTSIDVVSEASDRFKKLVPPAMKYTDFCIINEIEAQNSTGITLRGNDGRLKKENIPSALKEMKNMGVSRWAVIHSPEGGFGLDENNEYVDIPSLNLPKGFIKGTVGAGDAFCSGVLYAAHEQKNLYKAIEYGTACAACSLSEPGASDGVLPIKEALELYNNLR
ncbi:MAG TPA: carbohydrate kinase family protein [Clostridia bacterium]|nr:MAG: putative sugar kinase YdjH [Firmicutes bacterium ADurb.Bin146]HOD92919.1 carbohydrate kinase family protein [Clostridia bacterium]HQM40037.1 carbohydrate kinase family protein [Clostridia bacterium]